MLICAARQFRRENFDVAAFHAHCRAKGFEAFQMQINRAIANDTAAGQCDAGFLAPTQQRSKNTNGRAHFANDIVGRDTVDLLGSHSHGAARAFHLRTQMSENLEHVIRIAQVGHAMNDTRLPSQQCRGEDR